MARASPLRGATACALLAAACFVTPIVAADTDSPPWLAERTRAAQKAVEQNKLLLVIDLGGDFLADPASSPEARIYRSLAMSDRRVADLLASRYIVSFRNVGPSASLRSSPKGVPAPGEISSRPGDFALAFICTPAQRVLHFVPGLVSADALLAELTWADACNRDRLRASLEEQTWTVHQRHRTAADPAHQKVFTGWFHTKWDEAAKACGTESRGDLAAAISGAKKTRDSELMRRLKLSAPAADDPHPMLAALAAHGELEPMLAHLVLAEFPLPKLSELEQPLYQMAFGQRVWQQPSENKSLLSWWDQARGRRVSTLLVVRDDPYYARALAGAERLVWPPPLGFRMSTRLRVFDSKLVTLDELAALASAAGLEPVRFAAAQSPPRYLVHSAAGFRLAQLSAREGTTQRLSQTLQKIADSGGSAAASDSEGEPTDEDK